MADVLTKKQRSYCMSRIRSKWTAPEKKVHNYLKSLHIKHKMHPKISGNPDVLIPGKRTAIFVNGCFWHMCKKCYKPPKSNIKYWLPKIKKNIARDKTNTAKLKKQGFIALTIWEHELKNSKKWKKRISGD